MVVAFIIGAFVASFICFCVTVWAAYHNGVVDGYGYSREPDNPGYREAGQYLRAHMQHRWPELERRQKCP